MNEEAKELSDEEIEGALLLGRRLAAAIKKADVRGVRIPGHYLDNTYLLEAVRAGMCEAGCGRADHILLETLRRNKVARGLWVTVSPSWLRNRFGALPQKYFVHELAL